MQFVSGINGTKFVERSRPRLRFVMRSPPSVGKKGPTAKPSRGRPASYKPLLVAIDSICRRGVARNKDEESFTHATNFKRGRRRAAAPSEYEKLKTELARDWALSVDTVHSYIWDDRFYSPLAAGLVDVLLKSKDFTPRLSLDEIGSAVAELQPRNMKRTQLPLSATGKEFNLLPSIRHVQQSTKQRKQSQRRQRRPPR